MSKTTLGPLEKQIMECIWEKEPQTVRDIHTCISDDRKVAYTTIMTIMGRLVNKGFLKRKMIGKTHEYYSKTTKKQSIKNMVYQMIATLRENYGEEAVSALTDELDTNTIQDEK